MSDFFNNQGSFEERRGRMLKMIEAAAGPNYVSAHTFAYIFAHNLASEALTLMGRRFCEVTGQYYFLDLNVYRQVVLLEKVEHDSEEKSNVTSITREG